MPRGGRRPGAGAPKGNMNGWRTGRHCRRAVEVITEAMRLWNAGEREKVRSIWLGAFEAAGLPRPPAPISSEQVPVAVQLLHQRLFDCETTTQSNAINRNQSERPPRPSPNLKSPPNRPKHRPQPRSRKYKPQSN